MRLLPHRRTRVVFSSSARSAGRCSALQDKPRVPARRIRRFLRIGMLLTVLAVRPRWRPLLAAIVFTVFAVIGRAGVGGVLIVPGLLFFFLTLLTPGDTYADGERRAQLKRELAAYSTPAQRRDLEAILDRYPDGVTCEIRDILASQAMASRDSRIPGAGPLH
jgi:hypothetical protein